MSSIELNGYCFFYFQSDVKLWRIVFFLTAGYYLIGNTSFVLFGKGTIQPWNYSTGNTDESLERRGKKDDAKE